MSALEIWITHDRDSDELVFVAEGPWDEVKRDLPELCLGAIGIVAIQSERSLTIELDLSLGDPSTTVELHRQCLITDYRSSEVARREETWIVQALA